MANVLVDATGRIAEEEAFETLSVGRFVDRGIVEALLVQLDVGSGEAEYGFDHFLAGLYGSADLVGEQVELGEMAEAVVGEGLFPSAERL